MAKLDHLGRSPGSWCLPALRPKLLSCQTHFQAKPDLLAPGFTQQTSLVAVFPLCSLLFWGPELSDLEVSWGGPKSRPLGGDN